jgi:two-component sensor histidine kinase
VVSPHAAPDHHQLEIRGPALRLNANAATTIALVLHELATNASKYGSLSGPSGRLSISWRVEGAVFLADWVEEGGPAIVDLPIRNGFGTKLARQSARGSIGGDIEFAWTPAGVRALLRGKLALMLWRPTA